MCEISFKPKSGQYHLFHFPSCDGINVSGRGMEYAIISASKNETIGYYKRFKGPIQHIRSYDNLINIMVVAKDFIPLETNKYTRINDDYFSSYPYRSFCIYDIDGNNIPFSAKLVSDNLNSFMKSIGVSNNFNIFDYNITRNGCIQVKLDIIETNNMIEFEDNIVDLNASNISFGLINSKQILNKPVGKPTYIPTSKPTNIPIIKPTDIPISNPSDIPVSKPTDIPISKPTNVPINNPDNIPTEFPSDDYQYVPNYKPTFVPTIMISNYSIKLDRMNGYSTIITSEITKIDIICKRSTVLFIHFMKGHIVSIYDANNEFISLIKEDYPHKIINFGESNGKIVIEKISE